MSAIGKFSKGSSTFLNTFNTATRRSAGRSSGIGEVVGIMSELQSGPKTMDDLALKSPAAKRIVFSLLEDGMLEPTLIDSGQQAVQLSPSGIAFMKQRASY